MGAFAEYVSEWADKGEDLLVCSIYYEYAVRKEAYVGREDEELFLKYLKQNQYMVYQDDKDGNPKVVDKWSKPYSGMGWFILYLYREDFGKMIR